MEDLTLKLDNLNFTYPLSDKKATDNLSLEIKRGEKVAIIGRNGMGKSTLFFLANGVIKPDSGKIFLGNNEIKHSKDDLKLLRESVGLVFQDPDNQFVAPTVEEEISFGPLNLGYSQDETREIVDDILRLLKIENLRSRSTHSLSGGEKKIVSIGSVMALYPDFLIFDETTAGLDNYNSKNLLKILDMLHDLGLGIIISTHEIDFAWEWSEKVIIIKDGKVAANGPTNEILTDIDLLNENKLNIPYIVEFTNLLKETHDIKTYPKNMEELKKLLK